MGNMGMSRDNDQKKESPYMEMSRDRKGMPI